MAKKRTHEQNTAAETNYRKHRERVAARDRAKSADGREIGPCPKIVDPDRRAECGQDLKLALETYFPETFALAWSSQHIETIDALQLTLRTGGMFALGMPRGSGKTSLCVRAGILAMLYGWRKYLVLIGAVQDAANEMLDVIRIELESNELLLDDFPEVCFPIRALDGIAQRAKGQTVCGEPTAVQWGGRRCIVLPYVAKSLAAGSVIQAAGLLTRLRGMQHTTRDGKTIRPDCFLGDDLQTDQSARNVAQVERRETVLNGAVQGLAGPGKRMAGLATLTIQRKGDLADRMLDRRQNPIWQGRKFALVERWPDRMDLWEEYARLREEDLLHGDALFPRATKYYRQNRKAMDHGAIVPWDARREPHELSALQNAFNLRFKSPVTFEAEYQNNPLVSLSAEGQILSPDSDMIVNRVNGYGRGEIPQQATHLVAGIDVQKHVLFWLVAAIDEAFTGWIVDYGAWPKQSTLGNYWTLDEVQITISTLTKIQSLDGSLFRAIGDLCDWLLPRRFQRDDGSLMTINQAIIDANWGPSTKSVYSYCRQTKHTGLLAFHGRGITAKQQPLALRKKKRGERAGDEWFLPSTRGTKAARHVIADTNMVKSTISERLMQPVGEDGAWTIFQGSTAEHRMLADHLSAEYPIETEGRGRKLLEWELRPGRDNHWFDCAVMCATGALMLGCAPSGTSRAPATPTKPTARKTLAQMRAEAQARRAGA